MSSPAPLGAYLGLTSEGLIAVRMGKVELGQGIGTALAKIAAQALELPLSKIQLLAANTRYSLDEGFTSGSLSVQQSGMALRKACLFLRSLCQAKAGSASIDYASLIEPSWWALPVQDMPWATVPPLAGGRLDLPARIRGEPMFIHDLALPKMLHARVLHAPRLEARPVLDSAALSEVARLRTIQGVKGIVQEGALIAVVTTSEALAKRCFETLTALVRWEAGRAFSEADAFESLPEQARDTTTVLAQSPRQTSPTTSYFRPAIAHASIAPSCALARWDGAELEVWTHGQGVFPVRKDLALALNLKEESIVVQHALGAGCYGHNAADDTAFDAAWLAMKFPGHAIRVQWTHEQELTRAPFGSAMRVDLEASLGANDGIATWTHEVFSGGHSTRPGRAATASFLGAWALGSPVLEPINMPLANGGGAERNAVPTYELTATSFSVVSHRVLGSAMRTSALRSLGAFANVFAAESMVDELLHRAGKQALEQKLAWRIDQQSDVRAKAVLCALQQHLPSQRIEHQGWGLGFARYKNNGAYCAVLAQVDVETVLRVKQLFITVDVGEVVDHDGVENQIEGGAIQATSWALKEAVTFDTQGVTSADWESYPILRFSEVPRVHVQVLPSPHPALGAGEASMGPTAGAIGNALFDAIGVRVRRLPFTPEQISSAIHHDS